MTGRMSSNSNQIKANIQKAANIDIPRALTKGLEQAGLGVERAAKENAQYDSVRNSLTHAVVGNEVKIFSTLDHAPYIEAGTGIYATLGSNAKKIPWVYYNPKAGHCVTTYGMEAKPFLKPAVQSNLSAILNCFEGLI